MGFAISHCTRTQKKKIAFVTPFSVFEWLSMLFGLCNASAIFQSFMEEVLEPYRSFTAGFLDIVTVWADSFEELNPRLLLLFARFVKYGLILNPSKCKLFVAKGIFHGFSISEYGNAAGPEKLSAVRSRPIPAKTSEIRGFVDAAGYLRSLIKTFHIRLDR